MKVYFIGIGGIGVSALAQHYLAKGHEVYGFDLVPSEITDFLKKKGVVFTGKTPEGTDLIIYTSAIKSVGPLLKKALANGIKVKSYPEALGELTKDRFTVAVSGTHGKSTTSSMLGLILEKAGLDPTVIIGTKLKEFGNTNFREGKSKYLVIEADEWNRSFLNYWPQIIVLTNIEEEHMDTYKDLKDILGTYQEYINHLSGDGVLVANGDDKNISKLKAKNPELKIQDFSLNQGEAEKIRNILKIPGDHNVCNALAALTAARELGIPDDISLGTLAEYKGAWRRFEEKKIKIGSKSINLVSDYGHHPTEVMATLKAAREKYPNKKLICVFQPHQYQRTHYLLDSFMRVFRESDFDEIIITDIYDVAGRENREVKRKINSKKLVKKIDKDNVVYVAKEEVINYLKNNLEGGEIVIVMGAGDIYKLL
jgi:UDP-N-acetylmuramate--alanine ligase